MDFRCLQCVSRDLKYFLGFIRFQRALAAYGVGFNRV